MTGPRNPDELLVRPTDPHTTEDYLAAIALGGPAAVEAALRWCSTRLDARLATAPDHVRRVAVNAVDRAGNELRERLGWPERDVTYERDEPIDAFVNDRYL